MRTMVRAIDVLQEGVRNGAMPGGVVCVFRRGELILHEAFGTLDGTRAVFRETFYDLASLTKPLATGATLLTLVEAGKLTLTATVGEFLADAPEPLKGATLKQLLTHTSGLPAWIPCYESGLSCDAAVQAIFRTKVVAPGTKYEYSCLGFILLKKILEVSSGRSLDALAFAYVFAPLGLKTLTYHPSKQASAGIAPTISREGPNKDTVLTGIVHDGNARAIGGISGNAGLFGSALDVARFGEMLRVGGKNGLFGAPTRDRILNNQVDPAVGFHTCLFFAQGNGFCPAGDLLSPQTVGHSGYTGTLLTIDPTYQLTVSLVTNSVYGDGKASFLTCRRRFLNAVAAALD
ncbi:MAG: serine hydrolase domain-containing protein [Capsulimonadales bacterium]|nr:serine hydrolase domain-containing protein [Capsulimonadales bacterium]